MHTSAGDCRAVPQWRPFGPADQSSSRSNDTHQPRGGEQYQPRQADKDETRLIRVTGCQTECAVAVAVDLARHEDNQAAHHGHAREEQACGDSSTIQSGSVQAGPGQRVRGQRTGRQLEQHKDEDHLQVLLVRALVVAEPRKETRKQQQGQGWWQSAVRALFLLEPVVHRERI